MRMEVEENDKIREGVEQATFLPCDKLMAKDVTDLHHLAFLDVHINGG